jgi:muconolactone delta-isomerase
MMALVICRPVPGADQASFASLVPAESAALGRLKAQGSLTQAWSPGRPGAVLMLEVRDEAEAADITAGLPLVTAGLITTEILPLHPLML